MEHRTKTGSTTRVIDYVETPYYELCESQLEQRMKAAGRIVKSQIEGSSTVMREQFWTVGQDDYVTFILNGLKADAKALKEQHERQECAAKVLIEVEKTKQAQETTKQAVATTAAKSVDLEILKVQLEMLRFNAGNRA
jgi:uncharacterized protein with GYD domain